MRSGSPYTKRYSQVRLETLVLIISAMETSNLDLQTRTKLATGVMPVADNSVRNDYFTSEKPSCTLAIALPTPTIPFAIEELIHA